jgi:outer membrane protein assembly factor BamB
MSAIDEETGTTIWRSHEAAVRESIGISEDSMLIYGKTMQDTIVAFRTNTKEPEIAWRLNAAFGYEHVPSMLVEKDNNIFFGTRNGVVYAISRLDPQVLWKYKIDNSMVNTVNVIDSKHVIASTMDGKVCLLAAQ